MIRTTKLLLILLSPMLGSTLPTIAQSIVSIEQKGNGSISIVDQFNADDSKVDVYDTSTDNVSTLIKQEGSNNLVAIMLSGEGHRANLSQIGRFNEILIDVSGTNSHGHISQDGQNNKAHFVQNGSLNYGVVQQYQSDNQISLEQHGNDNFGTITQEGRERTYLLQEGRSNEAVVDQSGGENVLKLRQIGGNNGIEISQLNGGNELVLEQRGYNFNGSIIQSGDARASIIQTETGFRGSGNLQVGNFDTSISGDLVSYGLIQVRSNE
ncbi:MAG: hypothetical protein AAGB04_01935 [Pseudomonadota bacterium]